MGSGYVDQLFLEFGISWRRVASFMLQLVYHRRNSPLYPLDSMLGGAWNRSGWYGEAIILDPTRTQILTSWRMASSGMLRRVVLVRTDVSEEFSATFFRVTRIGELGTMLAVISNRRTLWRNTRATWRNIPVDAILHSHHRENLKSLTAWSSSMCIPAQYLTNTHF
jgi:hypothetical protein